MTDTPLPVPRGGDISDRLRGVALGLCIPLGVIGAHRFYVGKVGTGLLQLVTIGGLGLWWLYDLILISAGEFRDAQDRRVELWSRRDPGSRPAGAPDGRLAEEMDVMQGEMRELAERVDFLERLLAQQRERGRIPSGRESPED